MTDSSCRTVTPTVSVVVVPLTATHATVDMIGHGCPQLICQRAFACGVIVALVAIGLNPLSNSFGQDFQAAVEPVPPGPTANLSSRETAPVDPRQLLDASTRPFEFRSSNPEWPLVRQGDPCQLTIRVRGFAQSADLELSLSYDLVRVEDGSVVRHEQTDLRLDKSGDSEEIAIAASSPEDDGVYEVRCRLIEKPDRLWSRLTRSPNELASVKTPWIVFPVRDAETDSLQTIPSSASASRWRERASIDRITPPEWHRPTWMPPAATKLVPNVKRVSESLTLTPWRDDAQAFHTLAAGESFVGQLADITRHQPYQVSLTIGTTEFHSLPSKLRVEFASSPTFERPSQALTLRCTPRFDVSSAEASPLGLHDILHYAASESEFIRITNLSDGKPINLHAVTLSESTTTESNTAREDSRRNIVLWVQSTNWLANLVSDYQQDFAIDDYADSTQRLFRLSKAISRLKVHADWCGYDEVNLPFDMSAFKPATNPDIADDTARSAGDQWMAAYAEKAIALWTKPTDLPIVIRAAGQVWPGGRAVVGYGRQSDVESVGVGFASAPSIQVLELLCQNESNQIAIQAGELPLAFNRSFRQTLSQVDQTPTHLRAVASSPNGESDYVHVFVSEPSVDEAAPTSDEKHSLAVTVVNSAPWTCNVKIQVSTPNIEDCTLVQAQDTDAVLQETGTPGVRSLTLGPASIVNLRFRSSEMVRLASWQASMVGGLKTMETLKGQVSEVVAKIGTLALPDDYQQLRNGSFELQGQVGIIGWMHTQFPESAVTIDSTEAMEGTHSIRMTSDTKSAGRIWLVSEPIPVPRSGRMAVSLSMRANKKTPPPITPASGMLKTAAAAIQPATASSHQVRISLEGIRLGKPVRFSTEFGVPCDGLWQPRRIVLETDRVPPDEIDTFRLTIDSLSPGKLWIDDVHLHDQFATESERIALQGNAFLAIQGLQRGNLKPAAGLLNNDWSRYLLTKAERKAAGPRTPTPASIPQKTDANSESGSPSTYPADPADSTDPSVQPSHDNAQRASVADRLRDWLPRPIRF